MTTILCFGDSNTWGISPDDRSRFNEVERWTGVLSTLLGEKFHLIEAGQPNRTLVKNFPFDGDNPGITYLASYLLESLPDLVIIMLGTNDLKKRFDLSPKEISEAMSDLATQVMTFSGKAKTKAHQFGYLKTETTKLLIVSPPAIFEVGNYSKIYEGGTVKSKGLAYYYEHQACKLGCDFFDADQVITSCEKEGIHWPKDQHLLFAQAIYTKIVSMHL